MSELLCPTCAAWRSHPEDRFCGHCGDLLLKADATVNPSVVYKGLSHPTHFTLIITPQHGNLSGTVFLWRNTETGDEKIIEELQLTENEVLHHPIDHKIPFERLQAMQTEQIEWKLIHRITDDHEAVLATVSIGKTLPELDIVVNDIVLNKQAPETVMLQLRHVSGDAFNINKFHLKAIDHQVPVSIPQINESSIGRKIEIGETIELELQLPEQLIQQLDLTPLGVSYALELQSPDLLNETLPTLPVGQFSLRIAKPAIPVFSLPDTLEILHGHPVNLGFFLENRGGEALRVDAAQLYISAPSFEAIEHQISLNGFELAMGARAEQIQIPCPLQEVPIGSYQLKVQLLADNQPLGVAQTLDLTIKQSVPYTGIIVIDFGTTASAAACFDRQGQPNSLALSASGGEYIPTAVAYYLDGNGNLQYCIGEQAQQKRGQLAADKIRYLDNIKWRLNDRQDILLPDGSRKRYWQVAADYLTELKQRIETHPLVMGQVEKVCISQPARFDPRLAILLMKAYEQAGMHALEIYSGDQPLAGISESWPSSMLCLTRPAMLAWQKIFMGKQWEPETGDYYLLNVDVGGGSTDLSLLSIDIPDRASIRLREIASDGDNTIAGNYISELIYRNVSFYQAAMESDVTQPRLIDPRLYPVLLPWETKTKQIDFNIASANGHHIFENIIFPIQKYEEFERNDDKVGLMEYEFTNFLQILTTDELDEQFAEFWITEDPAAILAEEAMEHAFRSFNETVKHLTKNSLSVTLTEVNGMQQQFHSEAISFDLKAFMIAFSKEVSMPLFQKIKRLVNQAEELDKSKLMIVVTGRGSMFPLINYMVDAYIKALLKTHETEIEKYVVLGQEAKTIVSAGGCYIGDLLTRSVGFADNAVFEPHPLPSFGITTGLDPDTGHELFSPICNGIPRYEDGWLEIPYPVRAGSHDLNITFCQNPNSSTTIELNEETNLGNLAASINVAEADASRTLLLVRMLETGQLQALIAVPPAETEQRENDDAWEEHMLGELQLLVE